MSDHEPNLPEGRLTPYIKLTPPAEDAEWSTVNFQIGMSIDKDVLAKIEIDVEKEFNDKLKQFPTLSDGEGALQLQISTVNLATDLHKFTVNPFPPEWWMQTWVYRLLRAVPHKQIRKSSQLEGKDGEKIIHDSLESSKRMLTLETAVINLQVVVPGDSDKTEHHEIVTGRFKTSGLPAAQPTSYHLRNFLKVADRLYNEQKTMPRTLTGGTLTYTNNSLIREVQKQTHFEIALSQLFNSQGADGELHFTYTFAAATPATSSGKPKSGIPTSKPPPKPIKGSKTQPGKSTISTTPSQLRPAQSSSQLSTQTSSSSTKTGTSSNKTTQPSTPASASRTTRPKPASNLRPGKTGQISTKTGDKTTAKEPVENSRIKTKPDPARAGERNFAPQAPASPKTSHAVAGGSNAEKSKATGGIIIKQVKNGLKGVSRLPQSETWEDQCERYETLRAKATRKHFKKGGDELIEKPEKKPDQGEETDAELDDKDDVESEDKLDRQDVKLSQLRELQNNPDLSQGQWANSEQDWATCCQLFRIGPAKTGIDEKVKIAGLTFPLYQYQAYGVWWQMKQSRENGGGFLADEMGLGKTLSFLAYIVVERQLSVMWEDVKASRISNDKRHLVEGGQGHYDNVCPSQRADWITCPCVKSSPSSRWEPKSGLRLAVVPPPLVANWRNEFVAHIEFVPELNMKLIIAHVQGAFPDVYDIRSVANQNALKAVRHALPHQRVKYAEDTAQKGQDRILIVTTAEMTLKGLTNSPWTDKFAYPATTLQYGKDEKGTWTKGKNPGLVFGIAMSDEFHEQPEKGKGRCGVLTNLPHTNQPFIWGYSGTPFPQTPRTLEGILWAIESHWPKRNPADKKSGWDQLGSENQGKFSNRNFDKICRAFEAHLKKDIKDQDGLKAIFEQLRLFLNTFMIRRTADVSWFGHPLLRLKPHDHYDVILKHRNDYDADIARLNKVTQIELAAKLEQVQHRWDTADPPRPAGTRPKALPYALKCRVVWRMRIMATFPYLVKFASTGISDENPTPHLELTAEECLRLRRSNQKQNVYTKNLKRICENSPKCLELFALIKEMDSGVDWERKENKMVIMSEFNPVILVVQLFIEKYIKDKKDRVGVVYAGMKPRDRTAVIEAFTDAVDAKGERKQKANYQFLIGTTRLIGSGLQLTRSNRVVMMEPQHEFFREIQAYARVHRIGQNNDKSESFRLIDAGSEIEMLILGKQSDRDEAPGKFLESVADPEDEDKDDGDDKTVAPETAVEDKGVEDTTKQPSDILDDTKVPEEQGKSEPTTPEMSQEGSVSDKLSDYGNGKTNKKPNPGRVTPSTEASDLSSTISEGQLIPLIESVGDLAKDKGKAKGTDDPIDEDDQVTPKQLKENDDNDDDMTALLKALEASKKLEQQRTQAGEGSGTNAPKNTTPTLRRQTIADALANTLRSEFVAKDTGKTQQVLSEVFGEKAKDLKPVKLPAKKVEPTLPPSPVKHEKNTKFEELIKKEIHGKPKVKSATEDTQQSGNAKTEVADEQTSKKESIREKLKREALARLEAAKKEVKGLVINKKKTAAKQDDPTEPKNEETVSPRSQETSSVKENNVEELIAEASVPLPESPIVETENTSSETTSSETPETTLTQSTFLEKTRADATLPETTIEETTAEKTTLPETTIGETTRQVTTLPEPTVHETVHHSHRMPINLLNTPLTKETSPNSPTTPDPSPSIMYEKLPETDSSPEVLIGYQNSPEEGDLMAASFTSSQISPKNMYKGKPLTPRITSYAVERARETREAIEEELRGMQEEDDEGEEEDEEAPRVTVEEEKEEEIGEGIEKDIRDAMKEEIGGGIEKDIRDAMREEIGGGIEDKIEKKIEKDLDSIGSLVFLAKNSTPNDKEKQEEKCDSLSLIDSDVSGSTQFLPSDQSPNVRKPSIVTATDTTQADKEEEIERRDSLFAVGSSVGSNSPESRVTRGVTAWKGSIMSVGDMDEVGNGEAIVGNTSVGNGEAMFSDTDEASNREVVKKRDSLSLSISGKSSSPESIITEGLTIEKKL